MPFQQIAATQTDADSPLDQVLMDKIRLNFDDHETRLLTFTPADGTVTTLKIVDANVTLAKLKMAQGSWSVVGMGGLVTYTVIVNNNAHLCRTRVVGSGSISVEAAGYSSAAGGDTGVQQQIRAQAYSSTSGDGYVYWDYHTN